MAWLDLRYSTKKLTGGHINRVFLLPGNTVVKWFGDKGLSRSSRERFVAEWWALKYVDLAPALRWVGNKALYMSFIDGEKSLDDHVDDMPEETQQQIFAKAGELLLCIHKKICLPAGDYHSYHRNRFVRLLRRACRVLCEVGFNPLEVYRYLVRSYDREEIQRYGLVLRHGDYWLNNLVGRVNGRRFEIAGVIDWELSGMGSPYEDFALVQMSMERAHGEVSESFWQGYTLRPDRALQTHFSVVKIIDWLVSEEGRDFTSPFYQDKLQLIKQTI